MKVPCISLLLEKAFLSKVCCFGCVPKNSFYLFDKNDISSDATKRNYTLDSSICCSIQQDDVNVLMYHNYGNNTYKNTSTYHNECYCRSGTASVFQNVGNGEFGCKLEYSSIANSTSRNYNCIHIYSSYSNHIHLILY